MTFDEVDAVLERIHTDLEGFKRELKERARREHPELTEEQLEWSWKAAAYQFGLE